DTFKCLDEDEFASSDNFVLEQSQGTQFVPNHENAIFMECMESKPLRCAEPDCPQNTSPNASAEEVISITPILSTKFTFGSQLDSGRQYMTTFEEAFKNYYDSQHRISSQNAHYYTMPIKSSKDRSKRKGCHSRPERNLEPEPH